MTQCCTDKLICVDNTNGVVTIYIDGAPCATFNSSPVSITGAGGATVTSAGPNQFVVNAPAQVPVSITGAGAAVVTSNGPNSFTITTPADDVMTDVANADGTRTLTVDGKSITYWPAAVTIPGDVAGTINVVSNGVANLVVDGVTTNLITSPTTIGPVTNGAVTITDTAGNTATVPVAPVQVSAGAGITVTNPSPNNFVVANSQNPTTAVVNPDGSITITPTNGAAVNIPAPASGGGGGGSLLGTQVITASGTYTPTPGTKGIIIEMVGGGGAGAGGHNIEQGIGGNTASRPINGNGGSSGSWLKAYVANPVATPVTIGLGGAAAIPTYLTNGADGGDTIFGSFIAKGGHGGKYINSLYLYPIITPRLINAVIPASPMSAGMFFSAQGNQPEYGGYYTSQSTGGAGSGSFNLYSNGGSTPYGRGGDAALSVYSGTPNTNGVKGGTGAGGGAAYGYVTGGINISSGAGGDGMIIIYEYA
jgi:hypothetical protein